MACAPKKKAVVKKAAKKAVVSKGMPGMPGMKKGGLFKKAC